MKTNGFNLRWEIILFILFFTGISAFILAFSPIVQLQYVHDAPVLLDGAYRIQNGQVPHIDFSSILGHAFLYQMYVFLRVFNYDMIAIAASSVTFTALMVALYLFFYRSQTFIDSTTLPLRLYIFLLITALGLGQYALSCLVGDLTYACLYNRYCFQALLLVNLMLIVLSRKSSITKPGIFLLAAIALLLNYLLFSKITFFIVAASLIGLFLFLNYISFNHFKYLVLFSLIVFFSFLLLFKQNFFSVLKDYKSISDVRTGWFKDPGFIFTKLFGRFNIVLIVSYGFLLFQLFWKKAINKIILLLIFFGIMSVFLHFTNFGNLDIVFLTFIPVLFILPDFTPYRSLLSFKIILLCSCIFIVKNFRSIALMPVADNHAHTTINNKYVKHFYSSSFLPLCNIEYSSRLEDGVQLINKNARPGEKVMSFTFEAIFPFLTHTVPPKNIMLVWQDEMTYSKTKYPDGENLFNDVNLLLIPKCDEPEVSPMKKIYSKIVRENFIKVEEDNNWSLYRKKTL
jgi:hypothetical protein